MTAAPIDVILDVDTGVDDALALVLAARHPALRLRAVTCVAGNTTLANVVRNTSAVLALAGANVPVGAGADRPLIAPFRGSPEFHGANGLAGIDLPAPDGTMPHALDLLRESIEACPSKPTIIALGPLTNIALLTRTYPRLLDRVERIVCVGGATAIGNATPVADFNFWSDPEAAAIALSAPCPITLYTLDVFYDVCVAPADIQDLRDAASPGGRLCRRLLSYLHDMDRIEARVIGESATTIGDAGAVCAVIDPTGLSLARHKVGVATEGPASRGQSIIDRRKRAGEGDRPDLLAMREMDVAMGVDGALYRRIFLDGVRG